MQEIDHLKSEASMKQVEIDAIKRHAQTIEQQAIEDKRYSIQQFKKNAEADQYKHFVKLN